MKQTKQHSKKRMKLHFSRKNSSQEKDEGFI